MNYYQFHIGDFRSGTINMSRQMRWIYRDMLDVYYDTETPLPLDFEVLCDSIGVESEEERKLVERILRFKFTKTDVGYSNEVCIRVIADYHTKAETAKANGKLGGRPSKAKANPNKPSGFLSGSNPVSKTNPDLTQGKANETQSEANQEPITNNHILVSEDTLSPEHPATAIRSIPNCPHTELIDLFGKHLPTLPQPRPEMWDGAKAEAMRARWRWVLTAKRKTGEPYATTKDEAIAWFDRFFAYVAESDFLSGRSGKWTACDLGWLVKADNFSKVVQGNYINKEAA